MSKHSEIIAQLVGALKFQVDASGLQRFTAMMKTAETQMTQLGRQAEALQKKLSMKLGITSTSADRAKLDGAVEKALQKELVTKQKLARLQHAQNTAAISERKLVATGQREDALLQSASLKQQVTQAVLAAKQQKAQQELLKTKLGESRLQAASEQSKIREARLQDILLKRQAARVRLQQQAAMHQTKYARAEAALVAARASGIRQAERYRDSKLAAAAREARAQVRQDQQRSRFDFASERHEAWKRKQAEPQSSGLGGFSLGLGAAGAALYGLVSAVSYLSERITKRQEAASDGQQFDNTLLAAGNDDKERSRIREAYISNSQEFGMKIDKESAVAYSNMVQGFRAQGKTLEEAIQLQKDQAAVFRIGNLNAMQQYSARTQLNQGYSKDRFMGADLRPLTDALGTRLTTILYQAIGKALGYKGDKRKLAGFVLEAQHDGKVNGAMVQQGLRDIVAQSPELLERHKRSLDAQAARLENDKYLQGVSVNEDPELVALLGERLTAERELTEALKPLKESLMEFDKGLVSFNTSLIRMMIGHDANGSAPPNAMLKDTNPRPGSVGAALGPRLKSASPNEQASLDDRAKPGLWNGLRRLITGSSIADDQAAADANRERWGGGKFKINPIISGSFDVFKIGSPDLGVGPVDEVGQMKQYRLPTSYTAADIMEGAKEQQRAKEPVQPSWLAPGDLNTATINKPAGNVDSSMHNDVRVEIQIDARGLTQDQVQQSSAEGFRAAFDAELLKLRAAQQEVE
ncbi:hypothetical protein CS078_21705 [Pseudomonas prosekii]|uniref:Uncharacterized protein n=1 Tax=Pseudomonas prosekii TaxID=1148509 RepID=A0A3L8CDV0_9PSED|nr:hypothetical protein [Pseudomonas prosekii]RLU06345.1 hypothetical protein CS078_21705 [Pseudomonas prosekii]RLU13952.1 hypothetical protein CS076_02005 [Pseudomonas prosekii]